jgi:hypothetical protein
MIKTIAIVESGMRLDLRPNMVELKCSDDALHKYIAEVPTRPKLSRALDYGIR